MHKTLLILRHEFVQTVTRRGFIIMAIVFPLVGLLAIGVYEIVQVAGKGAPPQVTAIGYVDESGLLAPAEGDFGKYRIVPIADTAEANSRLVSGNITEYLFIPADYLEKGIVTRFTEKKELIPSESATAALRTFFQDNLLKGKVSPEVIDRVQNPLLLQSIRLDETGQPAKDQGGFEAFVFPILFGFLLIITIMATSGYLLQGLGEEKENRIMEVLLSSVSPRQLLVGKVLGIGTAGLLQMIFWLVVSLLMVRLASSAIGGFFAQIHVPPNIMVLGFVYFILGYLLFAVLMAGLGAIASTAREGQQLSVIIVLPAILPFYTWYIYLQDNPQSVIGTILTLIPITAPMSVFVRLAASTIAPWEYAASIVLLLASIVGGMWLAAKVFRVFLLSYGKRPNFKEIIRLVRQA
jgi:ABC-2 type transport system permease protein